MSIEISKFEWIPNEILFEIFEYLSSYDIFQSFYFLNQRYDYLLRSLHLRIDLIDISKKIFDYHNYLLFNHVSHRIISFRCEDVFDRLIYQIHLAHFIALKYLTISQLNIENLQAIIPQLNCLQELIYLNLQTRENISQEEMIIFKGQLPLIEKCILNINQPITFHDDHFYPNLRHLTINQCTIEDFLSSLISYTPQLQYLTVTLIDGNIPDNTITPHHLKSLIISTTVIPFHRLVNSIFPLFPDLQRLSINAIGIDYTNGKQWSTLLSTNFTHLMTFQLHITFPNDNAPTANDRLQLLNTFQTSYFRVHQWSFAILHHPSTINITLFSVPIPTNQISSNLYQTEIQTMTEDQNLFENIQQLSLFLTNSIENPKLIRFPNAENLQLISEFREYETYPKKLLVDISHRVNFSKLKSIEFIGRYFPSTSLVLLDYTPNLHSLIISFDSLTKMTKVFTDEPICRRLTTLIKHLTIKSIDNVKNLAMFERLTIVFSHLHSLSLSILNPQDLYILMILILPKMSPMLKTLIVSIEALCKYDILDQFMIWLMDYMHKRDLDFADVKLTGQQVSFCF